MAEEASQSLAITIGDQTFRVRVAPGEEARYRRIAQVADGALKDVLESGVMGGPRALTMALFQLAVELDEAQRGSGDLERHRARLSGLIKRIDSALVHNDKL